jgi:uncharacterized protein (TIRG00374 family)
MYKKFTPYIIAVILLIGLIFIALDFSQIKTVLASASARPIPFALVTTIISYFCISYSFTQVSKLLGVKMKERDLVQVGFVSTVLNHVISSGGAAGYSVRYTLMNRHGVSMREVLAVSFLHFYITTPVMIGMLPVGLFYLSQHAVGLKAGTVTLLAVLAIVVLAAAILATLLLFSSQLRQRLIRFMIRFVRRATKRDVEPALQRFDETLTLGVKAMRNQPGSMIVIMSLVLIDWIASVVTLWFCFQSLGVILLPGQVITGFVIGIVAGVASMIPGGLGVQEGSMAGIFALLGVSLDRAALASILFRVVYFFVPYLVSLLFYWGLLRKENAETTANSLEVEHAHPDA